MPTRNPKLTLKGGTVIQNIGDVHLDKKFVTGVPLENRGIFESKVKERFRSLLRTSADVVVQVGDIFDKFYVDNAAVLFAAKQIIQVAGQNPNTEYVIIRGNHDASKDRTRVSSFDVLFNIVDAAELPNLTIVMDDPVSLRTAKGDLIGFVGYSAKFSAKELVAKLDQKPHTVIYGHWDLDLPSDAPTHNLIPVEDLEKLTDTIVVGHTHKPVERKMGKLLVTVTGSMFPYAHGEEIEGDDLFYTLKVSEYDPKKHEGKFIRFIMEADEVLPEGDFLQVRTIPVSSKEEEDSTKTPTTTFNLEDVLKTFLEDNDLDDKMIANIIERFKAQNVD